ncbi:hypothetical protein ACWEGQ_02780 [Streptomyces seoulensis]
MVVGIGLRVVCPSGQRGEGLLKRPQPEFGVVDDGAVLVGDDAVGFYEYELARLAELRVVHGPTAPDGAATAGLQLVRLLHDLNTEEQPTWAWPLPGGKNQWRRIASQVIIGKDWLPTRALPNRPSSVTDAEPQDVAAAGVISVDLVGNLCQDGS